jgi:hypothetical protein
MVQKRSIFGPLLLIAAGVVWLLVKSDAIPSSNLWALTHIWPYLLIAAGVGIILRSYLKYAAILMDVIVIGGVLLAIVYAPQLGWGNPSMLLLTDKSELFIGPGIRGSGNIVTDTRKVSSFDAVKVEYPARVLILQGEAESVTIVADDNLLPDLQTQVRNGTLEIFYRRTNDRHVTPTEPVTITITVIDLTKVEFSTAGDFTIEGVKTDNLDVSLSGAGNLELNEVMANALSLNLSGAGSMIASGSTDDLDVNISGFGDFKGSELHSTTANVNISGAGSATVWVDDKLDATISGAGSVNYYGSPDVTKQVSGVGGVSKSGNK